MNLYKKEHLQFVTKYNIKSKFFHPIAAVDFLKLMQLNLIKQTLTLPRENCEK